MEEIIRLIDIKYVSFFGTDSNYGVAKQWFYDFAEFLNLSGLSEEQIKATVSTMMESKSLDNMQDYNKTEFQFSIDSRTLKEEKNFFEYLKDILSKITPQYVLAGIEFAKQDSQDDGNFMDSFIKYIVITNFQDLHVDSEIPDMQIGERGTLLCKLGEFKLARLMVQGLNNHVKFDEVLTRHNLERVGIGTLLFRKLQGEVAMYFPGKDLIATNVLKDNQGAQRFYESMGAKLRPSGEPNRVTAIFPAGRLQELSEIPLEFPQLGKNNLKTEGSPVLAIREYISKIIQMQKQYLDFGMDIPKKLRIPEQIELSPHNIDYLLKSKAVDFIGAGKTEDEMIFVWKKTDEYPELELGVKRNDNGKCVLTLIKSYSMDGKEEFEWNNQAKEGKKGILIISNKKEALDELIDMDR